ncbi:nuclear factor 7, ovary-like [Protopterus annectens]|uniref:nuclear factor 7, ovary-like n=1 Tax=Protopterus annectens TaxID=7888 RepID=UPI001CFBDD66|nr:nuclear factor 7, ovary-like [Protopterus annectens]
MAARKHKLSEDLAEDLLCSVCLDLFNDPVMLVCGHNFCKCCIDKFWDCDKIPSCPECREEFPAKKYTVNRPLRKIAQTVKSQPNEEIGKAPQEYQKNLCGEGLYNCLEHKEALKLFCKEDGTPMCVICMVSSKHKEHSFLPLQEAVNMFQSKLKIIASALESERKFLKEYQKKQEEKIFFIQDEARILEHSIKSEFANLHWFLYDKEQQLIRQLKEETSGILGKMNEKLREIQEMSDSIQRQIFSIQSKMQQKHSARFLTGVKDKIERITKRQEERSAYNTSLVCDELTLGTYRGPLQYNAWKEMISIIKPGLSCLTLDPNTASPFLILSDDLTTARLGQTKQQLPDNPERFDIYRCVLGSEGFINGRHYWEVEVKKKIAWDIGVTRESSKRKGTFTWNAEDGYWGLTLRNGNKYIVQDSKPKYLSLTVKPQKIGVYLDYDKGQVSFYNADNGSHLYTFTDTFTERLFPYFWVGSNYGFDSADPLKLFHLKM